MHSLWTFWPLQYHTVTIINTANNVFSKILY